MLLKPKLGLPQSVRLSGGLGVDTLSVVLLSVTVWALCLRVGNGIFSAIRQRQDVVYFKVWSAIGRTKKRRLHFAASADTSGQKQDFGYNIRISVEHCCSHCASRRILCCGCQACAAVCGGVKQRLSDCFVECRLFSSLDVSLNAWPRKAS